MTDIEELKVEIRILKERIVALEARPVSCPANVPWSYPQPWSPVSPWTIGDPPCTGPTCHDTIISTTSPKCSS